MRVTLCEGLTQQVPKAFGMGLECIPLTNYHIFSLNLPIQSISLYDCLLLWMCYMSPVCNFLLETDRDF